MRVRQRRRSVLQSESEHQYEFCLVSFIDILGFESLVRSDDAAHRIFRVIEDLYSSSKEDSLPENTFFSQLSDAIIRVLCVNRRSNNDASVAEEPSALADIQLSLLERGVVVRGGVSMGMAYVGKNGRGPVFGPAMIRAYHTENEEAVYPRIVIDDDLTASRGLRDIRHLKR